MAYKVYNVSYDLKKSGKDYDGLHKELKDSPNWWHYLGSTWLIATNESASQLWERIRGHIDNDDQLLIIQVGKNYQGWLTKDAWDWIHKYVNAQ